MAGPISVSMTCGGCGANLELHGLGQGETLDKAARFEKAHFACGFMELRNDPSQPSQPPVQVKQPPAPRTTRSTKPPTTPPDTA